MIDIIKTSIKESFKIKEDKLDFILCALLSGGSILLTDDPGTGKTTLAKIISDVFSLDYGRVQFTPDISPSDITGINIFNKELNNWELHKGPVFNDILLVDEINRALPRAQSALLESMGEKQTTIDRKTYSLSKNFFVIATQNHLEEEGTFDLPSAQKDRFCMNLSLGDLSREHELAIMMGVYDYKKKESLVSKEEFALMKAKVSDINVHDKVANYALDIIHAIKNNDDIKKGVSLRAGKDLINNAKALAFLRGNQDVLPDHIFELVNPVLNHRIILKNHSTDPEEIATVLMKSLKKVKP